VHLSPNNLVHLAAGDLLQLHGTSAFDAAVHCASMTTSTSAVKKRHHILKQKAGNFMKQVLQSPANLLNRIIRRPSAAS
jgi:hypothetical protein